MKFITSVAVAATAIAVASAQTIAINDPNVGSVWTAGADNYLRWSGSCKTLGPAAKTVTVSLMRGPADKISFVAKLGTIDCSSETATSSKVNILATQTPGNYSLEFGTNPVSYSPIFSIANPTAETPATPPPANKPETATPDQSQKGANGAGTLAAGSMVAAAGVVVAALQFIL
ncbi:hypothetical protein BGZ96_009203 [Linnemannia gamsii]|uniref:Yeast cell wall synthesis Kre9/Knh1-like N-terminal domain-containing protein n=1 Tax=Linnemannia gamsii TaxID=64522 RepID=A0ABQ7JWQ7_9FUNG|nr:hypothetical protein BGZ96_009203 [Linnemannia gamsii]